MRVRSMEKTREKLESIRQRVASGVLADAAKIGAAAERALQAHHGYRYYAWCFRDGAFSYEESPTHLPREKRMEGKYVVVTRERGVDALDAVAIYKELTDVERGFRNLKDVLAMRPIYHRVAPRVKAHIFVAALAILLGRLLERRLKEAGSDLSAEEAMEALANVRLVTFQLPGASPRRGVSAPSPRAKQVLQALGITDLKPPTPPKDQEQVM
jgi:transposase